MPIGPQLTLARRRTQPAAVYIARLTATAVFAYLLALHIPAGTDRPVLAPLTALLVLQASLFQTIRSGIKKVVSVTAGVLAAVGLSAFVSFNWWLLGLLIGCALLIGVILRLGDDILEVPISAMLIFSSVGTHAAGSGRVIDTLVGTVAGLAGGLVFAPMRVQPAREAVGDLAGRLAALLDRMAGDLGDEPDPSVVGGWLSEARDLRGEIERVDDTLRQTEDSSRLNPIARRLPGTLADAQVPLRGGLETLERAALTLRFLARAVMDAARVDSDASPVRDHETRARLAAVLNRLAIAIRTYGELVQTLPSGDDSLESALAVQLTDAREVQDRLADLLEPRAAADGGATEWPLRGEILVHVDRLRTGLAADSIPRQGTTTRPRRSLRRPLNRSLGRPLAGPLTRPLSRREPLTRREPRGREPRGRGEPRGRREPRALARHGRPGP